MIRQHIFYPLLVIAAVGALLATVGLERARVSTPREDLRSAFYSEYDAYLNAAPPETGPWSYSREQLGHLQSMAHMGPGVLPYLIEEARRTHDINLNLPLGAITRISFHHAGWPGGEPGDAVTNNGLFVEWWDAGQERTDEMFADAYAAGDMLKMASLGIAALPRAMEKLDEGDTSMLEVVGKITKPLVKENITADAATCRSWWQANKDALRVPFPDSQTVGQ